MPSKHWYQITIFGQPGDTTPEGYEVLKAYSLNNAMQQYVEQFCGDDYNDYTIERNRCGGIVDLIASCPEETAQWLRATRCGDGY